MRLHQKFLCLCLFLFLCLALKAAGSAGYPFPQSVKYKFGIRPSASPEALVQVVQAAYEDWLKRYVTSEGCPEGAYRVHRYEAYDYDTVSEGIGWGMLITVLMDNPGNQSQKYFDGFWRYCQHYLNKNGLMSWKINKNGTVEGKDSATEADENIAMALLYAHKQWGSKGNINYLQAAKELISIIMLHEVSGKKEEDFVIKPGSEWGGYQITNPAYYDPAYYRVWERFDSNWSQVRARAYKIYEYFYKKYKTGLFPDWCVADGSTAYLSYNFTYDACQVPLKIGLDYLWSGEGKKYLDKLSLWVIKKTNANPVAIVDGYKLDGTATGKYNNASFVGPLAVAAMVSPKYQYWLDMLYEHLANLETGGRWGYYNDTLRLVSLLILSGNMPNLWESKGEHEPWLKG